MILTRRALFDDNDSFRLIAAKALAGVMGVQLTGRYEYILYRARLARSEMHRLALNLEHLRTIAVFREDRGYIKHRGFAFWSAVRATYDYIRGAPSGGASTIPQQLARTLFIKRPSRSVRRKIVEVLLAMWLSRALSKQELLEVYLASVRFEAGIYGVPAALKHFFGGVDPDPSKAKSFLLIERLSNVHSRFRKGPIKKSVQAAMKKGVINGEDAKHLFALYEGQIHKGRIIGSPSEAREAAVELGL